MSRRKLPTLSEACESFLATRANYKDARNDISVLRGPKGRVVGKVAPAPALAKSNLGGLQISRVSASDLAMWEAARTSNCGHNARRRIRFTVRAFLKHCIREQWLPVSTLEVFPALKKPRPEDGDRPWLRPEQVSLLLQVARESLDDYKFFGLETLLSTGVRASEFTAIKVEHLDLRTKTLRVRGKGAGDGKLRDVPVSDRYVRAWNEHIARHQIPRSGYVFFKRKKQFEGGNHREANWRADMRSPCGIQVVHHLMADPESIAQGEREYRGQLSLALRQRQAQLPPEDQITCKLNPQVMRRTFACLALIAWVRHPDTGVDLIRLQHMMGHDRLETTQLYLSDVNKYLNEQSAPFDLWQAVGLAS